MDRARTVKQNKTKPLKNDAYCEESSVESLIFLNIELSKLLL